MKAFVPGLYPRSEELVQATRDLDRGRTTPEAVDEQTDQNLARLVSAQQDAGFELLKIFPTASPLFLFEARPT